MINSNVLNGCSNGVGLDFRVAITKNGGGLFTVRPMPFSCMEKSGVRAANPGPFSSLGWHHYKLFDHEAPLHPFCPMIARVKYIFMLGGDQLLGHVGLAHNSDYVRISGIQNHLASDT